MGPKYWRIGRLSWRAHRAEAPGARPAGGAPTLISPVLTLSQELAEQETFQAYQASEEYSALQRELAARPQAIVSLSCGAETRRTPMARCLAAYRGAPSVVSMAVAPEDEMTHVVVVGEGDTLLVVTDRGRLFSLPAAEVALVSPERRGRPLKYYVPLLPDERITALGKVAGPAEGAPMILVTDLGLVYRMGYTAAAAAGRRHAVSGTARAALARRDHPGKGRRRVAHRDQ